MTALEVAKKALHAFIRVVPDVQEMAAGAEALRILCEYKEETALLFSPSEKGVPPTDKQVRYLRYLGYKGEVKTRAQAATLIVDLKRKG